MEERISRAVERDDSKLYLLKQHLIAERCIDPNLVEKLIKEGKLYINR